MSSFYDSFFTVLPQFTPEGSLSFHKTISSVLMKAAVLSDKKKKSSALQKWLWTRFSSMFSRWGQGVCDLKKKIDQCAVFTNAIHLWRTQWNKSRKLSNQLLTCRNGHEGTAFFTRYEKQDICCHSNLRCDVVVWCWVEFKIQNPRDFWIFQKFWCKIFKEKKNASE